MPRGKEGEQQQADSEGGERDKAKQESSRQGRRQTVESDRLSISTIMAAGRRCGRSSISGR